jgi:hypothetical protein
MESRADTDCPPGRTSAIPAKEENGKEVAVIGSKKSLCFGLMFILAAAALAQDEATPRTPDGFDPEPPPKRSRKEPLTRRMYVGGWLGAAFGDVEFVEAAPELGFRISPKFQLGGSLVYRYRNDKRFDPNLSTTDLGGALFGRYFVYAPLYLQAGVEQLNWEYIGRLPDGSLTTVDADHTSVLVGPDSPCPWGRGRRPTCRFSTTSTTTATSPIRTSGRG